MSSRSSKPLDVTKLVRLQEALTAYEENSSNDLYLDSVIKRFELTFEVSRKLLRRYLIDVDPSIAEIHPNELNEFIRRGEADQLLASGWAVWQMLRDARNTTVHDYGMEKAQDVARMAPLMLHEARVLLANIKDRTPREDADDQS